MVIGLGLAGSAVSNLTTASGSGESYNLIAILCGIIGLIINIIDYFFYISIRKKYNVCI